MHTPQFLRAKVIRVPLPLDDLVRDLEFLLQAWVQSEIHPASVQAAKDQRVAIESSEIENG